jgi:hypothetical protein
MSHEMFLDLKAKQVSPAEITWVLARRIMIGR